MDKILKFFIKDYDRIHDLKVRERYGLLSSSVGIIVNIALFFAKFWIGTISNSIAITSDAFNNLSDMGSAIFAFFGYKLAAQPPDEDHPFGHGRIEYLVSLVIAALILFVGLDFLFASVDKIINPQPVIFSWVALLVVCISILFKLFLGYFNNYLGHKVNSSAILAVAADSKSDVIATSATLVSLLTANLTDLPIDGIVGCVVSFFILRAGYEIIKDTVDTLIGTKADPELVQAIKDIVLDSKSVIGAHDLIVHNYGPGRQMASIHAEVASDCNLVVVHDEIDQLERKIKKELNVLIVIHLDPIEVNCSLVDKARSDLEKALSVLEGEFSFHDFRMVNGDTHVNLIFDLVVPHANKLEHSEIKKIIDDELAKTGINYILVITFDHDYY